MTLRRPALSAVSAAAAVLLSAATLAGLSAPAYADDPLTSIRINEVESNGGSPGDWVELRNNSGTPTDVGGLKLKDGDDTHAFYEIPAGTTIVAGGYLVIEEAQLGFGLGSADSARLFLGDGTTSVDSYTWAAHATATYGRCPDGTGAFDQTPSTKGATNDCPATGLEAVTFNEVESNGDPVGDWAELTNTSGSPVDIGGLKFKDGDDTHAFYTIPAGTTIAAGGFFVLTEAQFNFGLGGAETVRLYLADETTLVDSYSWASHAATTYGRCPDGTGAFTTTAAPTQGAANNCAPLVRVNEIESSGGVPGDWVELVNYGTEPAVLDGLVVKDADDAHSYAIPSGTTLAAGGYHVVEESALGFGLGSEDAARLFGTDGATLLDSYAWTSHAATSYGRCPSATGAFAETQVVTKGARNNCPGDLVTQAWPGGTSVSPVDVGGALGGDISGLTYDAGVGAAPGVLWAVNNGDGTLVRLLWDGGQWAADTTNGWSSAGKTLRYADGTGTPDTEGVAIGGPSSAAGVYTSTERNNTASGTSRPTILRYDVSGPGGTLTATDEWNIGPDLPGGIAANAGPEAIAWVPDTYLTAHGFKDEAAGGAAYDPASYPDHGTGLFFVALEADSRVYAYALDHADGSYTRIASFASGYTNGVMALDWEEERDRLWVVCDDTCGGVHGTFAIDTPPGPAQGTFVPTAYYERPAGMPNLNNEGFTTTPRAECSGGTKPVFWTDDAATGGHAIRAGTVSCTPRVAGEVVVTVRPGTVVATITPASTESGPPTGTVRFSVDGTEVGTAPVVGGTATLGHSVASGGERTVVATYDGSSDHAPASGSTVRRDPLLSVTLVPGGPLRASGWYTEPVQVLFGCSPNGSLLSTPCPEPLTLGSGAVQTVTRSIAAEDGGAASASVGPIHVDLDAPTVRVAGVRDGATYSEAPEPRCNARDRVSGVARCTVKVKRTGPRSFTVVATASDVAGNRAKVVETYRLAR